MLYSNPSKLKLIKFKNIFTENMVFLLKKKSKMYKI